ncbi:MAG: LamG-like jellyroll fold domain-containing protein, partial [Planctomycetota bacterium]
APTGYVWGNVGTNDPNQLYVALSDGTQTVVVDHPDPCAVTLTDWQEWNIELAAFTGLNLSNVTKVHLGVGDRVTHPYPGGSGAIYVDDIRACPPRCVATFAKPLYDIAQPYDCIVDEKDLRLMAGDWLMRDRVITTALPPAANLLASYQFEGNVLDSSAYGNHLTDPCLSAPGYGTGIVGTQALSLDGVDDHLVVTGVGIDGNVPRTITVWAKADHTNITDWTLAFGFTGNADASGGSGSHFNIGSLGGPGGVGAHVWGWEETIFTDEQSLDWHHYAMSYDGTRVDYYGDGVWMDTDVGKSNVMNLTHADRVHVGKRATSDLYFPGDVDDARIYNVVLSEGEIAYIATQGAATLHVPIVSDADLYQLEPQGQQWINFNDYGLLTNSWLETVLWP